VLALEKNQRYGKNVRDWAIRSQAPHPRIWQRREKVQRLNGDRFLMKA